MAVETVSLTDPDGRKSAAVSLLAKARTSDSEAREAICRHYRAPLVAYMRAALKDADEAEDAAHEVLARVLEALSRYEPTGAPFRTWVFRIARHYVIDRLREHAASRRLLIALAELDSRFSQPHYDTDERVSEWLRSLPVRQRQVMVLRVMLGYSPAEVAAILDLNPTIVRGLQYRAFATLRPQLEKVRRTNRGQLLRFDMRRASRERAE
jgi:RNA polymerase sigma-70 factor (ECF subfamily)